ncbi:protein HESO1-like [Rutidosis leptorrhynchoides]|uniref:protein HESO1-like n=1 Tax=Rutidosis leptorrhynchoides TaxID=125765 RepID=UPI003A9980C0
MAYREKVLQKKAEKFESKELEKIIVNQEQLSILDKLLNDAYIIRKPKPSEYEHRELLIRVFNDIAKEIYGDNASCPIVEEFGSFSMDLFTTESDLDLSVNFRSNSAVFPRDKKIKTLRKFARKFFALQNGGHVRSVQTIMTAKVPIVKVIDAGTGVECDLSVENRDGISKSVIIRFITSIDERFPKLSFLIKAWAKAHDINSSKDRTLNSLSIILLVAFHLQTRDPPILPSFSALLKDGQDLASVQKLVRNFQNYGRRNSETLGELFVSFFIKLSSIKGLWPKGLCASPYLGQWISKTWDTKSKIANMSVEDFTDRTQNVARAVGTSEVEEVYRCILRTTKSLDFFMNGQISESKLKESLFGFDIVRHLGISNNVDQKSNVYKEKRISQHVMIPKPILTKNTVSNSNTVIDLRAPDWSTRPLPVAHWAGTQPHAIRTVQETLWAGQATDRQSTKRKWADECGPEARAMKPAWGEPRWDQPRWDQPRWNQGWGGAPTGGWGGVRGGSQEIQPVEDRWGRGFRQAPYGSSSSYGQPFR